MLANSPTRFVLALLFLLTARSAYGLPFEKDLAHATLGTPGVNQSAVKPGTSATAAVPLDVTRGFHVQSATPAENLIPFEVKLKPAEGLTTGKPILPKGEIKEYKGLGKLSVYEGRVIAYVPFEVAATTKPGVVKLTGTLTFQACDEAACFPPEDVDFAIEIKIAGPGDEIKPANARLFKNLPTTKPTTAPATQPAKAAGIDATHFAVDQQIKSADGWVEVLAPTEGDPFALPKLEEPATGKPGAKLTARGVLDTSALVPGKPATLAIVLDIGGKYHAQSHTPIPPKDGTAIPTEIESLTGDGLTFDTPIYPPGKNEEVGKNGILNVYSGKVVILVPVTVKADRKPGPIEIKGSVLAQICDDTTCFPPDSFEFTVKTTIAEAGTAVTPIEPELFAAAKTSAAAPAPPPPPGSGSAEATSIPAAFGLAFLVGILFNVVPCVLPVLPLKAVGFYETAQHNRAKSVTYGLAFSLGVIAVFALLGLLVVVLKVISWGELFSNPWFTGTLVIILLAMAANMFGLFNVNLPAGAYAFSPRHDTYFGNFLFGILTATLSTPCTFGLFVTVLTIALAAAPITGLLMVIVVGVGMAFPYVVLSALPEVARKFPRSGPWAELVKQFMAFLILGVAIFFAQGWIASWIGPRLIYWVIYGVIVAGCLFLFIRSIQFAKTRKAPIIAAVIGLLIAGPGFVVARDFSVEPYQWRAYTPELLAELQSKDQIVLIDFTATWCVNCHTLEATVLNSKEIQRLVADQKIAMVKADITDKAEASYKFWKFDVKAVGVPLTMVYPPGKREPISLPGIYSIDDLKAVIGRATQGKK